MPLPGLHRSVAHPGGKPPGEKPESQRLSRGDCVMRSSPNATFMLQDKEMQLGPALALLLGNPAVRVAHSKLIAASSRYDAALASRQRMARLPALIRAAAVATLVLWAAVNVNLLVLLCAAMYAATTCWQRRELRLSRDATAGAYLRWTAANDHFDRTVLAAAQAYAAGDRPDEPV